MAINLDEGKKVVSFGDLDVNTTETQLHYFSNLEEGLWAVMVDHLDYNGSLILPNYKELVDFTPTNLAYIDTSNSSIQVSESEFNLIKDRMQKEEASIKVRELTPDTNDRVRGAKNLPRYQLYF